MSNGRLEYRFKLDAYSPETIPMERLAMYLRDLAVMIGETEHVHFVRLESNSTIPVVAVEWESVPKVNRRINDIKNNEGPEEARRAKQAIDKRLAEDNASGDLIAPSGGRVLHFPGRKRAAEPEYGPFNQPGTLDGTVILVGGERDPVPVHLQDPDGNTIYNCYAPRLTAKRLAGYLFEAPVRVTGIGRWFRDVDGRWEMKRFTIAEYVDLRQEPLSEVVTRLRKIRARWKTSADPIGDIRALRYDPSET